MQNDTAVIRTANFTHAFYRSGEGIFGKSNGERIELINNATFLNYSILHYYTSYYFSTIFYYNS